MAMTKLSVLIYLLVAAPLCAQSFNITYIEGYPIYQSPEETFEITIGDELTLEGALILENGDYLEMESGEMNIKLTQAGTYFIESIYSSRSISSLDTGKLILDRLVMKQHGTSQYEVTAGVRGDEQVVPDDLLGRFEDVDYEDYTVGMEYYEAGEFEKALERFQDGMEWEGANYDALYLHSILCLYELSRPDEIRSSVESHSIHDDSIAYSEYMFFRINWHIENYQFLDALDLLNEFSLHVIGERDKQLADFLFGCCYYSLNDRETAIRYFSKSERGPSDDIANQSGVILESFEDVNHE